MTGVMLCCHVRRYMRVSHVMLRNALYWVNECCMGLVLGRKPEDETVRFFCVKWLQPAMQGTCLVCAAVAAAVVSCVNWFLLCVLQRVVVPVCVVLCVS